MHEPVKVYVLLVYEWEGSCNRYHLDGLKLFASLDQAKAASQTVKRNDDIEWEIEEHEVHDFA